MGAKNSTNPRFQRAVRLANFLTNFSVLKLEPGYYSHKQVSSATEYVSHTTGILELDLSNESSRDPS